MGFLDWFKEWFPTIYEVFTKGVPKPEPDEHENVDCCGECRECKK